MPLDLNFFMVSFASSGIDRACGIAEMNAVSGINAWQVTPVLFWCTLMCASKSVIEHGFAELMTPRLVPTLMLQRTFDPSEY